jgi:hypothetical protein
MARFCAVRIALFVVLTEPGVINLRLPTSAEAKVVLPATVMSPDVSLPNCKVVAFRNGLIVLTIAKAEADAAPKTMERPEVLGAIRTRPLAVADMFALAASVSEVMAICPPVEGAETAAPRETPPATIRISPDDRRLPDPALDTEPDALKSNVAD